MKPFVAVDADTMIFSAAAICEERSIDVLHAPSGIVKEFKNRTEFKEHMKNRGKTITEDYQIYDKQEPFNIAIAQAAVTRSAEKILDNFNGCEVVFCAGDSDNFRMTLPYPSKYKGNRDKMLRPVHLTQLRNYFKKKFNAISAKGHEVDDEVPILAYEAARKGRQAFVLSPDGDSRQFNGLWLGNYDSTPSDCVEISLMHPVKITNNLFDSYGLPWLAMQCLVGDATDNLNPGELFKIRYGEKTAYKDLKDLNTPQEISDLIVAKYKKWFPGEFLYTSWDGKEVKATWKEMLDIYWKGTTMKRDRHELPDYFKFMAELGVKINYE